MLVFIEKKLVLYAMPKTGSTALHSALAPYADIVFRNKLKHMKISKAHRHLPQNLLSKDTGLTHFVIMREPMDWIGSWYRYRSRDALREDEKSTAKLSFDQFIDAYLSEKRPAYAQVGQQSQFLRIPDAFQGRRLIAAYERMDEITDALKSFLGFEFALEWQNESPIVDLSLSAEREARLRQFFAPDFALHHQALSASSVTISDES